MAKHVTDERFGSAMERIDQCFDHVDQRLNRIDQRFTGIDGRFDGIQNTLEGMATILQRLDQERLFTVEWIRRIESDVSMMKDHLKLA